MIKAIAEFEPVTVCCNPSQIAAAKTALLPHATIDVIELLQDDAWFRDTGPTVSLFYDSYSFLSKLNLPSDDGKFFLIFFSAL